MNDIVTNAIDKTCTVTGDCKNTDYSKMQNCINDLRIYNDMMTDKSYYQQVEELQELRKENQQLKEQLQQKENEIKELCKKIKVNEKSRRKMQKSLMGKVQKSEKTREEALELLEKSYDFIDEDYNKDLIDIYELINKLSLDIDKGE